MKEMIINCQTGEQTIRDLTAEEIARAKDFDRRNDEAQAKRQALLDRLGITAEEAKLLLG
jgi:hypothetical protein